MNDEDQGSAVGGASPVAGQPIRARSTHPPVGNPLRCARLGTRPAPPARTLGWIIIILIGVGDSTGCGTVGPPIPPEEVGLAAKIIEQKEKERRAKQKDAQPAEEEKEDEVALPPVRPIGTPPGLN